MSIQPNPRSQSIRCSNKAIASSKETLSMRGRDCARRMLNIERLAWNANAKRLGLMDCLGQTGDRIFRVAV